MERVVGRDLAAWRAQRERSLGEIIDVFVQAGRGLAAAHKAGLVHRDVKPHNILVGDDGRVRVVNFGLARAGGRGDSSGDSLDDTSRDDTRPDDVTPASTAATPPPATAGTTTATSGNFGLLDASITIPGDVLGTPAYMAPEQHRCEPIDARANQFSFCVSLWEALAGERPFAGASAEEILARISRRDLGPPPRVPRRLVAALRRGLSPLPCDRFPELAPLLVALERSRPGRRRLAVAAAAVALVAAGGGIYVAASTDEQPRVPRRPRRRVGWRGRDHGSSAGSPPPVRAAQAPPPPSPAGSISGRRAGPAGASRHAGPRAAPSSRRW